MSSDPRNPILAGHKALIVGIANEHSIAYGCAKAFREQGAELAITCLNDKAKTSGRALGPGTRHRAAAAA